MSRVQDKKKKRQLREKGKKKISWYPVWQLERVRILYGPKKFYIPSKCYIYEEMII